MEPADKQNKDISHYQIQMEIGRGASGVCYKAIQKATGKVCAIKKICINTMKGNSLKLAMKQVTVLKSLNHPHIIQYYDSFTDEHNFYIVMKYACKGDLHAILKKRKIKQQHFSEEELWKMGKQLLEAIEYLHVHNIVHRDVKTLNIFTVEDGSLMLGDLGVSKILKNDIGLYSRVGTPLYLAPQIIKYEKYDYKADIWGLGCVMYILTTLNHPFQGKNIVTLGQNILNSAPKPIFNYSQELQTFILKMLQKNPQKRPDAKKLLESIPETTKIQEKQKIAKISPQKNRMKSNNFIKEQIKPNTSNHNSVKQQKFPNKINSFQSQRRFSALSNEVYFDKSSEYFKVVLPIKEQIFKKKDVSLQKKGNTHDLVHKKENEKESGEETILLKPNQNRYYQYCIPNQKTQLRSGYLNSYINSQIINDKEEIKLKERKIKKSEISFQRKEKKDQKLYEIDYNMEEDQREIIKEDVKNKIRTEEHKRQSEVQDNMVLNNNIRRRCIRSAIPGKQIQSNNFFGGSSNNFQKESVFVNVNKISFQDGCKQKKAIKRPQSSLGRKMIGQRQIHFTKKKNVKDIEVMNSQTRTQFLNKPEMLLL